MSERARQVLAAATKLSDEERAELIDELLQTLPSDEEEQAWHKELLRRRDEAERGLSTSIPWEAARAAGEKLLNGLD